MVPSEPATGVDDDPAQLEPYAVTLESGVRPHARRIQAVSRLALLDRLQVASDVPVVAVTAPPGYGKTMLLAQWAQTDPRPFAWLSIESRDNDPAVLVARLAAALDESEPMAPDTLGALTSPQPSAERAADPRLLAALADRALPIVIVLDDLHLLQSPEALELVAALVKHLPPASQVALAGRGQPALSFGSLRAERGVVEIGADSLAMSLPEATSLLKDEEVRLSRAEVEELVRWTEGWPVALHLSALSLKEGHGGDQRSLGEYVQARLLTYLPPKVVSFLTRTAVLEQLSGPLCDAVLGRTGSARVLESLEQANLLVVPVDRHRTWYRYHRLFRELLLRRLKRDEPELVPELLLRAAGWCEGNGRPVAAVEYAMAAGDAEQAARLVVETAIRVYDSGGIAKLGAWVDWFDRQGLAERYPAVATLGAWAHANLGDAGAAERWLDAAERAAVEHASSQGTLPDGSPTVQGWLSLVRAMLCRDGAEQMRIDAEVAVTLVPVDSPWRPMAHNLLGAANLLAGEVEAADRAFMDAVDAGIDGGEAAVMVALAERAALAIANGQWTDAELLTERAHSIVRRGRLEEYVTSALLYAVAARLAIRRGELARAREDLARVQRLRSRLTHALPLYAAQTRLELVRAHIALTDLPAARAVLAEVDELLLRRDMEVVRREADELRIQLDAIRANAVGPSLTAAEFRLLHLLGTHHSFREIGDQLFLSRHTVKSHAMSIYRKFGVSSRGEAIRHARDLGLLAR